MKKAMRILLLLALLMTIVAVGDVSATKPPPPLDCSQYNTGSCFYHWDANDFCCKPSGGGLCVWHCL